MKKLAAHVTAISLLAAGSAFAADMRLPAKAPAPVAPVASYSWTGCFVGAGGGYGMSNSENSFTDGGFTSASNDNGGRGWFGTVSIGCDYQVAPQFVIGAFADYDFSAIKGDHGFPFFGYTGQEKLKQSWAAGGRIGWLPFQQLMVFVSGGYTEAQFGQVNFLDASSGAPTGYALAKHTYNGWFIGSGYEYAVTWAPGLTWKTEYRFSDFSEDAVALFFNGTATGENINSRKFVQTVRSELVWRFNFGGGSPVVARY